MTHETVGRRFRAYGGEFLCTRWVRNQGFWMRCTVSPPPGALLVYEVGRETCVSERAIDRTFHRIYDDAPPEAHEAPCECWYCIPHERLAEAMVDHFFDSARRSSEEN